MCIFTFWEKEILIMSDEVYTQFPLISLDIYRLLVLFI